MRKAVLYGVAVVCVCLLFALSGPQAQKVISGNGNDTSSSPVPVAVSNFPQIQPVAVDKTVTVTGSVAVTNLPAVQQVAGTVNVGNLPVDADGNVKVVGIAAAPSASVHFVGYTPVVHVQSVWAMTTECNNDFPGTRACTADELFYAIPPPPDWTGDAVGVLFPLNSPSRCVNHNHEDGCAGTPTLPIACCGY
jgi:hypothetical protein